MRSLRAIFYKVAFDQDALDVELMRACKKEDIKKAKALLEAGAEVNCCNNIWSETPLMQAAINNNGTMLKLSIEAGADVNRPNVFGSTPLMLAAEKGIDLAFLLASGKERAVQKQHEEALAVFHDGTRAPVRIMKPIVVQRRQTPAP